MIDDSEAMPSVAKIDPVVKDKINASLEDELNEMILMPEEGIQTARKILYRYGFDMPALYVTDPEGDEFVLGLTHKGDSSIPMDAYLYFIYILEDGKYMFHSEVADSEELDEILTDEEDEDD